jgi:hypothetical protein
MTSYAWSAGVTWYLKQVISAQGITVASLQYKTIPGGHKQLYSPFEAEYELVPEQTNKYKLDGRETDLGTSLFTAQAVESVTFPNGSIAFTYVNGSNQSYYLKKVTIQQINPENPSNYAPLKSYDFQYQTKGLGRYYENGLLTNINEISSDGASQKLVSLSYYQQDQIIGNSPNIAPVKTPFEYKEDKAGTDLWGYYNGLRSASQWSGIAQDLPSAMIHWMNENDHCFSYDMSTVRSPRQPELMYTKYHALKEISYQTGGRMQFDYELNTYSQVGKRGSIGNNKTAGGLRIKKITYQEGNAPEIVKTYSYHRPDAPGLSSGVIRNEPLCYYSYSVTNDGFNPNFTAKEWQGESEVPIDVVYEYVTESYADGSRVQYEFHTFKDQYEQQSQDKKFVAHTDGSGRLIFKTFDHPFEFADTHYFMRGKTKNVITYNSSGVKTAASFYQYQPVIYGKTAGLFIRGRSVTIITGSTGQPCEVIKIKITPGGSNMWGAGFMHITWFEHAVGKANLSEEKTIAYDQNDDSKSIMTTSTYTYNATGQVAEVRKSTSNSKTLITRYKYISDYTAIGNATIHNAIVKAMQSMQQRNQLALIEEQNLIEESSAEAKILSASLLLYKNFSSTVTALNQSIKAKLYRSW